jgi:hypothetical protein
MKRRIEILLEDADLPDAVDGVSALKGEDRYLVLVNSGKSDPEKVAAFLHECLHIYHEDHTGESVQEIETERHAELQQILSSMAE